MDTAATLFHVSFRQEHNVPWWDLVGGDMGCHRQWQGIGRFYLDMHPRRAIFSHTRCRRCWTEFEVNSLPEAILVCNFPEPTATDPGLMEYGDVIIFFHEFGHLMHHILGGEQQWAGISGISMEADFVEAPSQMLEEWMRSPQVLATFARHYKTGEPIPADLVARMNRAAAFGRANSVAFQNALAKISYDVYKDAPEKIDLDATVGGDMRRYTVFTSIDAEAHFYACVQPPCRLLF